MIKPRGAKCDFSGLFFFLLDAIFPGIFRPVDFLISAICLLTLLPVLPEARIPESRSKSEERPMRFVFEVWAPSHMVPFHERIYILSSISSHEFEYIKLGKTWRMSLEKRKGNFLVMGNSTG